MTSESFAQRKKQEAQTIETDAGRQIDDRDEFRNVSASICERREPLSNVTRERFCQHAKHVRSNFSTQAGSMSISSFPKYEKTEVPQNQSKGDHEL
jgi:hypothetical protein